MCSTSTLDVELSGPICRGLALGRSLLDTRYSTQGFHRIFRPVQSPYKSGHANGLGRRERDVLEMSCGSPLALCRLAAPIH